MVTFENVFQTYSGRPGCMCGCNGEYRTTDRAKKSALTRILKEDYKVQLWDDKIDDIMGCIFYETDTRNNVAYLRKGTELTDEMLDRVID
jgi:hypothetical protein